MKIIKLWLTTIAVLLCSITVNAEIFEVDCIYYNVTSVEDLTVEVYGGLSPIIQRITIPSTVAYNGNTYSVTSIQRGAFSGYSNLTSITIPEGVTSIGEYAFSGCSSLTSITIPESATSIGSYAFSTCSSLTSITIPEGVTSIGEYAFRGCSSLISTTIPESVTSIGNEAFYGCTGELTVKCNIPSSAFANSNFNNVVIEEGVMSIGEAAFSNCQSLTSITIPESVTLIGSYAFSTCSSLTSITIPEGVTSIGDLAFQYSTGELTVKCNIPSSAFVNSNFNNVVIEEGVMSIGKSAFYKCQSLTAVTIPESVTSIGESAFYGCSSLSSLTLSNGVVSIGDFAFCGCDALKSIIVPSSVTSVGSETFGGKEMKKIFLMSNTMPSGFMGSYDSNDVAIIYTSNSDYASYNKYKVYPLLSNMFEVDGITYVPTSMSERTCDVVNYDINRTTESVEVGASVSYRNIAFTVNNVNDNTFYNGKNIKEISLSNQGGLGTNAFENCTALASVELSECITSIGNYAFNKCGQLTSITLPASIAYVGYAPFAQCDNLASISVKNGNTKYDSRENCNAIIETEANKLVAACDNTVIPESVTEIGDYAFVDCAEITSLNIKDNINSIGDYAFSGCSGLTDVVIEDRTEVLTLGSNGNKGLFADCPLASIYIGGKIIYGTSSNEGYSPFYNNTSLQTVEITDREEQIYENEFYGCTNLTNVSIGNNIKSIGAYAFSGCSNLKDFSFGSNMESIGACAFTGCANLMSVTVHAVAPPVCGTQALNDIDKWNCTLNVPKGYANAYKNADQWKEFLYIEDVVEVDRYALRCIVDGNVYYTDSLAYSEVIVLPDAPVKEGYTFSGWSEAPETMPIHDVTITGSFIPNKYVVIYMVDAVVYRTDSVAYGDTIVVAEEPVKEGYDFSGWSEAPEIMPANDITISGTFTITPVKDIVIADTMKNFSVDEDLKCGTITYTRNFKNTNWQALYVPFEIPIDADFASRFDVAYFNDVRSYDDDKDGAIDRMVMELFEIEEGNTLKANYPYLIRAKNTGEATITVTDAVLYATEENSISCSSVFMNYEVFGTYTQKTAAELQGCYAVSNGGWKQAASENVVLNPFRLWLKLTPIDGSPVKVSEKAMRSISIRLAGEEDTTEIEGVELVPQGSDIIYDLQGRRVENPTRGIYIVNGKKVYIENR